MKIAYMSDIHLDMFPFMDIGRLYTHAWDVLVFAGDAGSFPQLLSLIDEVAMDFPERHIIVVPGNHEFYMGGMSVPVMEDSARDILAEHPNVSLLVKGQNITIGDVNFIGATLWSGLGSHLEGNVGDGIMAEVQRRINDFRLINNGFFDGSDCRYLYERDRQGIIESLQANTQPTTIVITHFSPSIEFRNEDFPVDALAEYFSARMDDVIEIFQPTYWISGHTHSETQYKLMGNTQLVGNQHHTHNTADIRIIDI